MLRIILSLFIFLFMSDICLALPLDPWTTWSTAQPYVSKQVPPGVLVARGIGTDAYYVIEVDPATGALPVTATVNVTIDYSGVPGAPVPAEAAFVAGVDPGGDLRGLAVDTGGRLQIDATSDNDFAGATGSAVPTEAAYIAAKNAGGDLTGLLVDGSGDLQVTVTGSALPTGSATAANQVTEIGLLTTIDGDTGSIDTNTGTTAVNTGITATNTGTTATNTGNIYTDTTAILADTGQIVLNTGGTETNTGLTASNTESIKDKLVQMYTGVNPDGLSLSVTTSDRQEAAATPLAVRLSNGTSFYSQPEGRSSVDLINYNHSTPVTTAAYTQIIASTSGVINQMYIFDSSGQGLILATGAAAAEVNVAYIPPGGLDSPLSLAIPAGTRLSIKALTANTSTGILMITGLN